jgi:FtsP/CotA-like multicopper oxidase with cupredoxin domain
MVSIRGANVLTWTLLSLSALVEAAVLPVLKDQPRVFDLTIEYGEGAPDGISRQMILVNGQFPAPMLEMNQGEEIEINVHNKLPVNTTIHFHGIEMLNTPWSDGVPGLTQRQIPSGADFTYKWTATQHGAYWYHAHERGQIDDGFLGPLTIHPTEDTPRPFDRISSNPKSIAAMMKAEANAKSLLVGDWREVNSETAWEIQVASGIETTCYDSIIFNGKGKVDCWSQDKIQALLDDTQRGVLAAGNETTFTDKGCLPPPILANVLAPNSPNDLSAIPPEIFDVCTASEGQHEILEYRKGGCDNETWVAIDLVATFGLLSGTFSIDEHSLWVYAVDGSYIEPEEVDALTIMNGNRYSFFVKLTQPGDYSIRFASTSLIQLISGTATLRFTDPKATTTDTEPSVAHIDDAGDAVSEDVVFFTDVDMKMFPADAIAETADQTFILGMRVAGHAYNWALNYSIYPMQLDNGTPLLFNPDPELNNNVTITTLMDQWIDIVFVSTTAPMPPHPIHKHGNKMWHIGQGQGNFPYNSVAEAIAAEPESFNLVDPPKRDTWATLPALSGPVWMAIRYHVDNAGAWFLHCHIQSHLLGGMAVAIQDGIDQWPTVPDEYLNYP